MFGLFIFGAVGFIAAWFIIAYGNDCQDYESEKIEFGYCFLSWLVVIIGGIWIIGHKLNIGKKPTLKSFKKKK